RLARPPPHRGEQTGRGGWCGGQSARTDVTAPSRALLVYVGGIYFDVMNAMTTIRVEASVRDRLAALAEAHGWSLGSEPRPSSPPPGPTRATLSGPPCSSPCPSRAPTVACATTWRWRRTRPPGWPGLRMP